MGGGAIRAAAKVAGITAATGGLRSVTAEHYSLSSAARKAAAGRPVAVAAAADDLKLVASNSDSGLQRPCVEFDDWVFPVMEEEVAINGAEPMPRVVFDGLPTLQEAKEATSELSVALEKAFLSSPNSVRYEGSVVADYDSSLRLSNKQVEETKACVTSEIVGAPVVPPPAIMAFKFLHESSMAKDVVASIACDPNVWNAVLQNQELQKFVESQRACVAYTGKNFSSESVADYDAKGGYDSSEYAESEHSSEYAKSEGWRGFRDFFKKMKSSVVDMLSSLSDYFKYLFGGKGADNNADVVMERSFMGLAVMAILVILLKRA